VDHTTLTLVGVAIAVLVFLDALFVEIRRILREGKRLVRRLEGYAEQPIFALLAQAEADGERISRALEALPALLDRGREAWLTVLTFGRVRPAPPSGSYMPNGSFPD
jgi:hypothetical protein